MLGTESIITLYCCDLYGHTHGDWVEPYANQGASNGNLCCIPVFCDTSNNNFTLAANSPCAPFTPPNEECDLIGAWPVDPGCIVTAAPEDEIQVRLPLLRVVPNPFNPKTTIHFELPEAGVVTLEIFDPSGRRVSELVSSAAYSAGSHAVSWNGADDTGQHAPSGVYFCRLQAGDHVATRKMIMLQ
jgi:hypothetical protein